MKDAEFPPYPEFEDVASSLDSEIVYEQIVESLTSGVIAVNRNGQVITANPAACIHLNLSIEELGPGTMLRTLPDAEPFVVGTDLET